MIGCENFFKIKQLEQKLSDNDIVQRRVAGLCVFSPAHREMIAKAPVSAFPVVGLPVLQPVPLSMPAFTPTAASGTFALSASSQFRAFWQQSQSVISSVNPFLAEAVTHDKRQEIVAGSRALSILSVADSLKNGGALATGVGAQLPLDEIFPEVLTSTFQNVAAAAKKNILRPSLDLQITASSPSESKDDVKAASGFVEPFSVEAYRSAELSEGMEVEGAGEKSAERESPSASSSGSSQSLDLSDDFASARDVASGSHWQFFSDDFRSTPLGGALKEHSLKAHQASKASLSSAGELAAYPAAPDADFISDPASLPEKGRGVGSVFAKSSADPNRMATKLGASKRAEVESKTRGSAPRTAFPVGKLFSPISSLSGRPYASSEDIASDEDADLEFAPVRDISGDKDEVIVSGTISGIPVERHFFRDGEKLVFAGWKESGTNRAFITAPSETVSQGWRRGVHTYNQRGLFGVGMPGGESAYKQIPIEMPGSSLRDRLVSMIISQLRMGPSSMENGLIMESFNAHLKLYYEGVLPLRADQWRTLIFKSMKLAAQFTPLFDRGGSRGIVDLQYDMASMLGIDVNGFYAWEDYLGIETISSNMFDDDEAADDSAISALMPHLEDGLSIRAREGFSSEGGTPSAKGFAAARALEWDIARLSSVGDAEYRAAEIKLYMSNLFESGMGREASMGLALIFANSDLNESASDGEGVVQRWRSAELRTLIKALLFGDTWSLVSRREFRENLSPSENSAINAMISDVNFEITVAPLREIDVASHEDEFWGAVEKIGNERVMDYVFERIVTGGR